MVDPAPPPVKYPDSQDLLIRIARFMNLLDDADNKLSPTKISLWGSTLATFSTGFGAVVLWLTNHVALLGHIGDVGSVVGGWWAGSAGFHHMDKRERNLQKARMKDGE